MDFVSFDFLDIQDSRGRQHFQFLSTTSTCFKEHLEVNQSITAEDSFLQIASDRTRTGNLLLFEHKLLTTKLRAMDEFICRNDFIPSSDGSNYGTAFLSKTSLM